jgi:hypothetical protein
LNLVEEVALTLPRVEEGGTLTDDCRVPLFLKRIGGGEDVLFGEMVVMHNTAWVEVANNSRLLWDRPSMTMEGVYKKGDLITLRIEYFPLLQCEIFADEKKET